MTVILGLAFAIYLTGIFWRFFINHALGLSLQRGWNHYLEVSSAGLDLLRELKDGVFGIIDILKQILK